MKIQNLTYDFDFKKILLGNQYCEKKEIKNVLLAKNAVNYVDSYIDYNKYYSGHVENYQIVEEVFKKVFQNGDINYKDIMNSFWTTYKFFLQIEYPNIFTPEGSLKNEIPLEKNTNLTNSKVDNGYPPFDSLKYQVIHKKYVSYYNTNYPKLVVEDGYTWNQFLIENYDQFLKVHDCPELAKFAKLTHTIGNIVAVPEGFNSARYFPYLDYWDLSLDSLKKIFTEENVCSSFSDDVVNSIKKSMVAYSSWEDFINFHYLNDYVDENYTIIPFWENHFIKLEPSTREEIIDFLTKVNICIDKRGTRVLNQIGMN